jgi:hypothetical protein
VAGGVVDPERALHHGALRTATEVTLTNMDKMPGFAQGEGQASGCALGRREWLAGAALALALPALPAFATETEGQPWTLARP